MNRKFVGATVAVLMAAVGTFILVSFVRGAEQRALAGEQVTQVYVVAAPIPKGTQGEALQDMLTVEQVPLKVRAAGAVTDLATLKDKVAAVELVPGEQLVSARFVSPEEAAQAVEIPDGLLETTIALDPQRALGGHLQPGDTVGLTASFDMKAKDDEGNDEEGIKTTHMILHKVLVTKVQGGAPPAGTPEDGAAQQQEQPAQSGATAGLMVTLALDAPSVERVVFAAEWGKVWLSNEPEDAPEDGTKIQTGATIYE